MGTHLKSEAESSQCVSQLRCRVDENNRSLDLGLLAYLPAKTAGLVLLSGLETTERKGFVHFGIDSGI